MAIRIANAGKRKRRIISHSVKTAPAETENQSERTKKTITITIDRELIEPGKKLAKKEHRNLSNLFEYLLATAVRQDKEKESAAA